VECAAFDESGDWLATLERREDGLMAIEARLKFWLYSKEKNRLHQTELDLINNRTLGQIFILTVQ